MAQAFAIMARRQRPEWSERPQTPAPRQPVSDHDPESARRERHRAARPAPL